MALDNSDCPEESRAQDDDNSDCEDDDSSDSEDDEGSDSEEDSSDSEEDSSASQEEITNLDISRKVEEATEENENVLRLEKERLQKDQLIIELKKKVEGLTEGELKMEQNMRDLERLNQEKERQIYSVSAEMRKLRNEMTEKAKETEVQIKEKEEKDQRLIILENTVVVLQMEKETLHRDLQRTENGRREMQVTMNKLNEDLEKLRQENGRKENHIESLNRQNENKTLKINDLEDELQILTTQKQMAHENSEQLDRCKIEIAEKKEELEKLKQQNLQKDREILRLQNECTQKHMEVICLLKESKTVVAEKPKANGKLNEMTRRRVQLEFELAEAKEELETMEFEKMEMTLELERLQEETLAKDTKIRSLETKVKILKGEKTSEEMKGNNLICKEKEACRREKNKIKMVPQEQTTSEKKAGEKKTLDKTRCLKKPNINCKALYRQMDSIEEELRQIMALQRPSNGNKRHSQDPTKTPSNTKPLNRKETHQKMRLESAAKLRTLERESEMVRRLYKINAVT
ncbi:uncharacterized protein MCAP_0864-like [Macrobrachium rosenbergii]|uniref:uncharacterized protein MCAP_0864-like n=1 Tax=Macrobrachium rosenbergii TaxID=79674 RepID=UPI0034D39EF7